MLMLTHRIVNIGMVICILGISVVLVRRLDQHASTQYNELTTKIIANHQSPFNNSNNPQDITDQQNSTCESEDDDDSARNGVVKYIVDSEPSLRQLRLPGTTYLTILQEITTPPPRI